MDIKALDLALSRLHERGAVHLPGWLSPNLAEHFAECLGKEPLLPAAEQLNGIEQRFQKTSVLKCALLSSFQATFADAIRANAERDGRAPSLAEWRPNESSCQVYDGGEGIGWHRDFERARLLIAVFNLRGTAAFHTRRSSLDWVFGAEWQLGPGDLVLMRGTGFQGVSFYGRPQHMVNNCSPGRVSLTLRMMRPLE
jgi:alkylated DNA repair dioxygenase AlkB